MPFITFDGKQHFVPGVFTKTIVRSSLPGPLPQFHVPIGLSRGWEGHPYNADALKLDSENDFTPFFLAGTDGAIGQYFGFESEMHVGIRSAKRHGLPLVYAVNLAPLTRFSILVESTGPVAQFSLLPKSFGAPPSWMKVGYIGASGTLTIVEVKQYAMIAQDVGATDTRIFVTGQNTWLLEDLDIVIGESGTGFSRTIERVGQDIGADGRIDYWIELDSALGAPLAVSADAIVLTYDEPGAIVTTGLTTGQAILDHLSQDPEAKELLVAEKDVAFDDSAPIDIPTPTALHLISAWGVRAGGTSPAPTSTDLTAFIALMNGGEFDKFAVREQLIPRTYWLGVGDSASHIVMRDYSVAERTRGFPISVNTGVRWGDTDLAAGDDTNPTFRSAALNSENVMIPAGGLDRRAAYLTIGAAIWGRRVEGGPGHNLTNDTLIFQEREVDWDEIVGGELSQLHKKGVPTYKLSIGQTIRYKISQGLSTLQANAVIWNETDSTTWSVHQRDLADFVNAVIQRDFEEFLIGADIVDPNSVAATLRRRAERSLLSQSFIEEFTITSILPNVEGNGFDVKWSVRLPKTNDFMTVETTILIGE